MAFHCDRVGEIALGCRYLAGNRPARVGGLVWVDVYPLTVAEQLGAVKRPLPERLTDGEELQPAQDSPDMHGYVELALRGGFPEAAFGKSTMVRRRWPRSYIRQIAERHAPDIDTRRDPVRIGRYFEACALHSAGLAQDKTYTAAGVNRVTAHAHTRLLADLRVVEELPAWSSNRLQRLVKAPKRYLADSALLELSSEPTLQRCLRDRLGNRFTAGVLLHTGPRSFALDERITAVPVSAFWS